jgi:xanthine/CO dehydrogenase XdhC/CoxF family maturation factor
VSDLNGKWPAEIAISVAADILARYQQRKTIQSRQQSKGAYGPQM